MVSRRDLVSQFEEIVQQDIINHNKQLLATNVALNDIRESINDLVKDHARSLAKQQSWCQKIERELNDLQGKFNRLEQFTCVTLDNYNNKSGATLGDLEKKLDDLEANTVDEVDFTENLSSVREQLSAYAQTLDEQKIFLHGRLSNINTEMNRMLIDFRQEIDDRPNDMIEIKEGLEQKIAEAVVDATGLLREMQVYKKDTFIMKKEIENLYTLIERLKKKQSS